VEEHTKSNNYYLLVVASELRFAVYFYHSRMLINLVPTSRLSFDCFQYANTEAGGLGDLVKAWE